MFRTKRDVDKHVSDILNKVRNENERNLRGYNFAKLYFQVKDFETAKKYVAGFLSIRDNYSPAYKLLGEIYAAEGNYESALRSFKKSLELDNSQKDVLLRICELYCHLNCDPDTARYWAERAEKIFPHHETVFRLRECIVNAAGEPDRKELEELIHSELKVRPRDVGLRIKLLKLYLDSERIQEAYEYAVSLEKKRPFPTNIDWYYCFVDICEAYQEEARQQVKQDFHTNFLVVLDHLVSLLLAEPHALVHGTDNNVLSQHSRSIDDVATVLQLFDEQLHKAWNVSNANDKAWKYFLQHMTGQLYLNLAMLLMKRAKKDQGNWKEACRFGSALLLVAYSFKPGNLLEEAWFPKLGEKQQLYTELWQQGNKRMTYAGYVVASLCKEDQVKWLQKIKQDVCIPQVQERIYQRLFSSLVKKKEIKESHFLADRSFIDTSLEFPSATSLQEYSKVIHQLYPASLHHLTWLVLQMNALNGKQQQDLSFQVFPSLSYATLSLNHGSPESLCQLDIDAFLYATVHLATLAVDQRRSMLPRPHITDAVFCVPPDIADPLCTSDQGAWWMAAYLLSTNSAKEKHGELRRILRSGLEVIRGVYNHGMEVSLVVHLARTFADRANYFRSSGDDAPSKEKALVLSARAAHYWNIALSMLDKVTSGQTIRTPRDPLFKSMCTHKGFISRGDFCTRDLSLEEISALREEGKLYLARQMMEEDKLDAAAEVFSTLNSAYASFYLSTCLKKLAEEILSEQKMHELTIKEKNKVVSLLTRARDSLYLTLDRLRGDKMHPLNASLEAEIGDVEAKLLRAEAGSVESIDSEDGVENDAEEEGQISNFSPSQNRNLSWLSSTPQTKESLASPRRGKDANASYRQHLRPSPERLDAQIRSLAYKQDSLVHTILEQQKSLMNSNLTLTEELKQHKATMEELKKQIEELQKLHKSKPRRRSHGAPSQGRAYNGTGAHYDDEYEDEGAQDGYYDGYYGADGAEQNGESEYSDSYGLDHSMYPHDSMHHSNMSYMQHHHQYRYAYHPAPPPAQPPLHMGVPFQPPHGPPPPRSYMTSPGHNFAFGPGQQMPQFRFSPMPPPPPPHPGPVPLGPSQVPPPPQPTGQSAFGRLEPPPPPLPTQSTYFSPTSMQQPVWSPKPPLVTSAPHAFQIPLPAASAGTPTVPPAILQSTPISTSQPPSFLSSTSSQQYQRDTSTSQSHLLSLLNPASSSTATSTMTSVKELATSTAQETQMAAAKAPEFSTSNGLLPSQSPNKSATYQNDSVSELNKSTSDEEAHDKDHEATLDFKPLVPLPAEVPVCTGEEGEKKLFEGRAKLFRFVDKEWKERGVGTVKLLLNEETGKVRFLMRRDQVLKVAANHYLLPNMELKPLKNSDKAWIWAAQDFADEEVRTEKFCIRFKTVEDSNSFKQAFDKSIEMVKNRPTKSSAEGQGKQKNKTEVKEDTKFMPIPAAGESTKAKGWTCLSCNLNNSADHANCIACKSAKPVVAHDEAKGGKFVPVQDNIAKPALDQSIFGKQVSQSSQPPVFTFGSASSALSQMAEQHRQSAKDSGEPKPTFGGFTFVTPPVIKESAQPEPVASAPKQVEETKKDDKTASPFASFVFPTAKSSSDKPIFGMPSSGGISFSFQKTGPVDGEVKKADDGFSGSNKESAVKSPSRDNAESSAEPEEFVPTAEFQPVVPLPELVEVKTGEEDEEKLFGEQAKLFRYDPEEKQWKERGVGELKILRNNNIGKSRILMRREQVLKICANHYIVAGMKIAPFPSSERTMMWYASDYSEGEIRQERLAARFKTVEAAKEFQRMFEKCQKDGSSSKEKALAESQKKSTETPADNKQKLSEIFKPKEGSWPCTVCLVQNDANRNECVACTHPRPGTQKSSSPRQGDTTPAPTFKFGMPPAEPKQDGALQKSTEGSTLSETFRFGMPASTSATSATPTFTFGMPVTSTQDTKPKSVQSNEVPLSEMFKPTPGRWECSACYVHNDAGKTTCVACETPKPKEMFKFQIPSSTASSLPQTSTPQNNMFTVATDASKSAQPTDLSSQKPLSELFRPSAGSWECSTCYVRNDATKTICVACESPKPGSAPAPPAEKLQPSFNFAGKGDAEAQKTVIKFGIPAASASIKPVFGSTPPAPKGEMPPIVFSATPQPSQPSKTFGGILASTPSTTSNEFQKLPFQFGSPTVKTDSSSQQPTTYVFGAPTKPSISTPTSGFVFGSGATTVSSTPFTFGTPRTGSSDSSASADNVQFRFGSPQKYEFNFSGVRPKSPTKTPKSPGTPSETSAEIVEEEVEGSEADNIYFQPVCPLPPKVETKTGEEEETMLYCQRAKLFRFASGEWKERGLGDLKILHNPTTGRLRLLMRRDQVLKVCLNHYLASDMDFTKKSDKTYSWAAADFSDGEPSPHLFTVRFKNPEIADGFKAAIDDAKKLLGEGQMPKTSSPGSTPSPLLSSSSKASSSAGDFSFKTVMTTTTSPAHSFSLSAKFGTSPSSGRSMFGNVTTPPKSSDETSKADDVVLVFEKEVTPEKKDQALKLQLPPQFYAYEAKPGCPGCRGCDHDDEIEIVFEKKPTPEQERKAQSLMLPPMFFLYEDAPPCKGCRGCRDEIPELGPPRVKEEPETPSDVTKPSPAATTQPESAPQPKHSGDTASTPEGMFFGSTEVAGISFADLAAKGQGFAGLVSSSSSSSSASKGFTFSGAGAPVFGSLQKGTSAENGDDDQVAPSIDVHFEPVVPLPPVVEVRTGEEDESVIFCYRAKLYRYDKEAQAWKERGVGDFKILKHSTKNLFRVLMRREHIHKVACNHYISPQMSLQPMQTSSNALMWMAVDYTEEHPVTEQFAVRFKTKEILDEFQKTFEDCKMQLISGKQHASEEKRPPPSNNKGDPSTGCTLAKEFQKIAMGPEGAEAKEQDGEEEEAKQQAAEDGDDDDEDAEEDDEEEDDDDVMFDKRVSLAVLDDASNEYKSVGMGELQIRYDDEFYGAKIVVTDSNGKKLCYHAIAIQTSLRTKDKKAYWSAIDHSVSPPQRRSFCATFSSHESLAEFSKVFEEGKQYAVESEVVENEDYYPQRK